MNLLEQAKQHAAKRGDPAMTAAKRKVQDAKARELYAAMESLSGQTVRVNGERGKLHVTLTLDAAHVNVAKLEKIDVKNAKGRARQFQDRGEVIDGWSAWFDKTYRLKRVSGPEREFADQSDLEAQLAKEVAAILEDV